MDAPVLLQIHGPAGVVSAVDYSRVNYFTVRPSPQCQQI
jgi:hypothetical protein